ncbi:MAG TPA: DUF928 domain-containing protein [Pyrinomonadaceae bacterium]|nr:DUF928 domain-containing protein [Pyrinomonadaceae bacterium]
MKYLRPMVCCSTAIFILATSSPLLAADAKVPVYKLPTRGAPGGRVGGGTRGDKNVFVLSVLAPDHSGLTTSEQPSLYWFISNSTSLPIELTVIDSKGIKPLLETKLPAPAKAGIQRVRLADYNIRLAPGVAYRWFVAVVPDADRRSKDILAGGAVERVAVPSDLEAKVAKANKSELFSLYADAGMWYDAVAAISDMIDAAPQDQVLRKQRAELLSQVGLSAIND